MNNILLKKYARDPILLYQNGTDALTRKCLIPYPPPTPTVQKNEGNTSILIQTIGGIYVDVILLNNNDDHDYHEDLPSYAMC